MKELKLPIIKGNIPPAKSLSMDDYVRFVCLNLRYTTNKEASNKFKRLQLVNVPFSIK